MKKACRHEATAAEIRAHLGVVDRTLSRWFDGGLPCKRGAGGKNPIVQLWDLVDFVYRRKPLDGELDPGDSPALERYREARAEEAERKNAIAMGELVSRAEITEQVRAAYGALRATLETAARDHPELQAELLAALDDAQAKLQKQYPTEDVA